MFSFRRFLSNKAGNVTIFFALSLVPLAGAAGMAVDYARAVALKTELQKAADATALAVIMGKAGSRSIDMNATFNKQFKPGVDYTDLDVNGSWTIANKRYRVTASAKAPTTMMSVLKPSVDVGIAATAELNIKGVRFELSVVNLDPEAGDYNELFVYCYNSVTKSRNSVVIDKAGTSVDYLKIAGNDTNDIANPPEVPTDVECGPNETLSIRMRNVRDGNSNPNGRSKAAKYDYYTDSVSDANGKVTVNTQPSDMVETIKCDTVEQCTYRTNDKPISGLLPAKGKHTPKVNNTACEDDFLYFGWEDRQPDGNGSASDEDYDDIRIVMRCKKTGGSDQMSARLVE